MPRLLIALVLALVALFSVSVAQAADADLDRARAGRLTLRDLPSGWTAPDSSSKSTNNCAAIKAAKAAARARSYSPDFAQGDNAEIGHAVFLYPTPSIARKQQAALAGPGFRTCMRDGVEKTLKLTKAPSGVKYGKVTSGALAVPKQGDGAAGARLAVAISYHGVEVSLVVDYVVVRVGRALSFLYFQDMGGVDQSTEERLTRVATRKVTAALTR